MIQDDDVPPLEDMTETVQRLTLKKTNKTSSIPKTEFLEPTKSELSVKNEYVSKILGKDDKECNQKPLKEKMEKQCTVNKSAKTSSNFCGFQKGFLSGESDKKRTPVKKPNKGSTPGVKDDFDITKDEKSQKDSKVFTEVQDAMKKQIPLLQSQDWVTEDLLTKIMQHPKLSKQFMDPRFSSAIEKFQKNPREVMEMCQTNEELREFIQQFCSLMGDHFTGLADQTDEAAKVQVQPTTASSKKQTTNSTNQSTKHYVEDEENMKNILSSPDIQHILQSPKIQQLFNLLRSDPNKAQRMLQSGDGEFRQHVQKLIDAGLLQMAR